MEAGHWAAERAMRRGASRPTSPSCRSSFRKSGLEIKFCVTDIFAVQDELTRQIISALKIKLGERERALIVGPGTKNVNAHDFFLRDVGDDT